MSEERSDRFEAHTSVDGLGSEGMSQAVGVLRPSSWTTCDELNPDQFEQLIGVDVKGRLVLHGLVSRRVAVSVKRFKSNVGAPDVQKSRGSLDSHELGVVMSTADFTPAARSEATAPGKAPVSLIGGRQLADVMIDLGIGVQATTATVFTLAPLPTGAPATGQGDLR